MDFVIAHFQDENSVAVIASKWMNTDGCYWPPYHGRRLDAAVCDWNILWIRSGHCFHELRILHQYGTFIQHAVTINGLIILLQFKMILSVLTDIFQVNQGQPGVC